MGTVRALVDVVLAVAVAVAIVLGSNVVHLVDGAALGATLDRAVAGSGEPDDNVRIGRVAGAAEVLLVTEGLDSCLLYTSPSPRDGLLSRMPSSA